MTASIAATAKAHYRNPDTESECRLARALITDADMGDAATPDGESSYQDARTFGAPECVVAYPDVVGVGSYVGGSTEEFVAHAVYAFDSGAAQQVFTALLRSCQLAEDSGDDASGFTADIVDSPDWGDDAIVVEWSAYGGAAMRSLYVRYGDLISLLIADADRQDDLDRLAAIVDGRVNRVGSITFDDDEYLTWRPCDITPTPRADPTAIALSDGLLGLDDLSIGWVEWPSSPCDQPESATCSSFNDEVPQASTRFVGPRGTVLGMNVARPPSEANEWLDSLRKVAPEGETCEITYDNGAIGVRFVPVDGAPFGDDVVVWKTYFDGLDSGGRGGGSPRDYARVDAAFIQGEAIGVVWGHFSGEPHIPTDQQRVGSLDETTIELIEPLLEVARRRLEAAQAR